MRKTLSFIAMVLLACTLMAQSVTLTFTGRDANSNYCQLDRVVITNLTKSWQETIYWPDTTLTMQAGTGIGDYAEENAFMLSQNNPNPFNCVTEADLFVAEAGEVTVKISDLNGRIVAEANNLLQAGANKYRVRIASAGVYFMTACQKGQTSSIKMVNNGSGSETSVEFVGMENQSQSLPQTKGSIKGSTDNPFSFGDIMEYVGYATFNGTEVESNRIQQMQGATQTFALQFDAVQAQLPAVTTFAVTDILTTSATCGGNVTADGGVAVIDRGICYNTTGIPTISDNCVHIGTGMGSFSGSITGLSANTTYYVRAYAINSVGVAYGDVKTFTTSATSVDGLSCPNAATLTDVDGNVYNTVQIGQQCWMKENLRTTKYADGTSISLGSSTSTITAYRYYPHNSSSNVATYGYLYNWKAVMHNSSSSSSNPSGVQGICPTGWHVPSDAEWVQLIDYVAGQNQYGCDSNNMYIAKALASTSGWNISDYTCAIGNNLNDNNATGFSAVATGNYLGNYANFGNNTAFWCSTETNVSSAKMYALLYFAPTVSTGATGENKYFGQSVRCVKSGGEGPTMNIPTITTASVTAISQSSATCGGNVTSDGGANVTSRGVCWSTSQNPTISDNHTTDGTGTGSFSSNITGLTANTTYYVRAYAINSVGVAYGNVDTFTTSAAFVDGQPCPNAATLTDVDGNVYNTVQIGQQCWMRENLRTTKYADGTNISFGSSTSTDIAYRYCPNNDTSNVAIYGYLYNWKAVMRNSYSSSNNPSGVQGVCPTGWHVPSIAEWMQLNNYVSSQSQYIFCGNSSNIAKALASTTGWNSGTNECAVGNDTSENNATGFSAVPAGYFSNSDVTFGYLAFFWSATQDEGYSAFFYKLHYNAAIWYIDYGNKYAGFSVRCVRD